MRRFIRFILQTIAYLLRVGAERTQWLADRTQGALEDVTAGDPYGQPRVYGSRHPGPPGHWARLMEVRPPEHWLAVVRAHAPHLLSEGFPQFEAGDSEPSTATPLNTVEMQRDADGDVRHVRHGSPPASRDVATTTPPSPGSGVLRLMPVGQGYRGIIEEVRPSGPAAPMITETAVRPGEPPSALRKAGPAQMSAPAPVEESTVTAPNRSPVQSTSAASHAANGVYRAEGRTPSSPEPAIRLYPRGGIRRLRETSRSGNTDPVVPAPDGPLAVHTTAPEIEPALLDSGAESGPDVPDHEIDGTEPKPGVVEQSAVRSAPPVDEQVILPDTGRVNRIGSTALPRWAPLLDEDEPLQRYASQPPVEPDDGNEHHRHLEQEQRGRLWNG